MGIYRFSQSHLSLWCNLQCVHKIRLLEIWGLCLNNRLHSWIEYTSELLLHYCSSNFLLGNVNNPLASDLLCQILSGTTWSCCLKSILCLKCEKLVRLTLSGGLLWIGVLFRVLVLCLFLILNLFLVICFENWIQMESASCILKLHLNAKWRISYAPKIGKVAWKVKKNKTKKPLYLFYPNTFRILYLSILLLFTFSVSGQLRVWCVVCCFIFAGTTRARPFTWSLKRTLRSAVSSVLWAPTR